MHQCQRYTQAGPTHGRVQGETEQRDERTTLRRIVYQQQKRKKMCYLTQRCLLQSIAWQFTPKVEQQRETDMDFSSRRLSNVPQIKVKSE